MIYKCNSRGEGKVHTSNEIYINPSAFNIKVIYFNLRCSDFAAKLEINKKLLEVVLFIQSVLRSFDLCPSIVTPFLH